MEQRFSGVWIPSVQYFVERKCLPSWSLARDRIAFHDLTYVINGEAVYLVNDKPYPLKKGDFIYIPGENFREAHTFPHNPMHCYAFNFQLSDPSGKAVELPLPTMFRISDDSGFISLYREFNGCWLEKNEGFQQQCTALFMLLLHHLYRITSKEDTSLPDPRLTRVRNHILAHFHEKLKVSELADIAGLTPVYFGSWFHKNTGQSIHAYINRIRINKARDLLSSGGCTVSDVAYRCGFEDPFYFSNVFKKLTGRSPSLFK